MALIEGCSIVIKRWRERIIKRRVVGIDGGKTKLIYD